MHRIFRPIAFFAALVFAFAPTKMQAQDVFHLDRFVCAPGIPVDSAIPSPSALFFAEKNAGITGAKPATEEDDEENNTPNRFYTIYEGRGDSTGF